MEEGGSCYEQGIWAGRTAEASCCLRRFRKRSASWWALRGTGCRLSVSVGLGVVHSLMEAEVDEVVG